MKAKLLLLLCCLFAIEGWANSNDIHLLKDSRSNPMGIPIQPTYEKCGHSCISPWQYNHVIQRS